MKCRKRYYSVSIEEVLFGIDIHADGAVYFSMSNKEWFDKLVTGARDGISANLVSYVDMQLRELYCDNCKPTNR